MIDRRNFIKVISTFAVASSSLKSSIIDDVKTEKAESNLSYSSLILPPALKQGDTIGITAPASATSLWEIRNALSFIKKLGCKVKLGATVTNWKTSNRYFSDKDEVRAAEFMEFVENEEINAILCARGGYGSMRILDSLDYDKIRKNPKAIVGFSDLTALLIAINQLSQLVTYHGPVAVLSFNLFTQTHFEKILYRREKTDSELPFKPIELVYKQATTINEGKVTGVIKGGNLSMICSTLGTPYEINAKDSLLFLEEVFEEPYKIDRMLTQLSLAGKLNDCNGIILGSFKNMDTNKPFYPGLQFSVRQIINQKIKPFDKPILSNFPIGHGEFILTLPLGIRAELDTVSKSLKLLEIPITM